MLKPKEQKQYGNKLNDIKALATSKKQAWQMIRTQCNDKGLDIPVFEDVFEIPKQ